MYLLGPRSGLRANQHRALFWSCRHVTTLSAPRPRVPEWNPNPLSHCGWKEARCYGQKPETKERGRAHRWQTQRDSQTAWASSGEVPGSVTEVTRLAPEQMR